MNKAVHAAEGTPVELIGSLLNLIPQARVASRLAHRAAKWR